MESAGGEALVQGIAGRVAVQPRRIDLSGPLDYSAAMAERVPVTVVETPEFLTAARKIMSEEDRIELVDHLAFHPQAGDLVPGSGGIRKLRWQLRGKGKRGGAR